MIRTLSPVEKPPRSLILRPSLVPRPGEELIFILQVGKRRPRATGSHMQQILARKASQPGRYSRLAPTERFVILGLPEPLSERSERRAAQDGEGSPDARHGAKTQMGFVVDLPYKNHSFAPAPGAATGDPSPSSAAFRSLRSLSASGSLRMTNWPGGAVSPPPSMNRARCLGLAIGAAGEVLDAYCLSS